MSSEDNTSRELPRLAWSLKETAEILGLSSSTVWRLVKRGKIRSVPGVRHMLIPQKEIERFLDTVEEVQ